MHAVFHQFGNERDALLAGHEIRRNDAQVLFRRTHQRRDVVGDRELLVGRGFAGDFGGPIRQHRRRRPNEIQFLCIDLVLQPPVGIGDLGFRRGGDVASASTDEATEAIGKAYLLFQN